MSDRATRERDLRQEWCDAVGARSPDDLDDWVVDRILGVEDVLDSVQSEIRDFVKTVASTRLLPPASTGPSNVLIGEILNNDGPIRLACISCDRVDCDGVSEVPADWDDVGEAESGGESEWWTHLGYCPDCKGDNGADG